MYEELYNFIRQNKMYCVTFAALIIACICGAWLAYDYGRNEPVYYNTNDTMDRIDDRINSIESRLATMQERHDKAEKAVSGTIVTIRDSREKATAITEGITAAEERLDAAIQRSGRIENLIRDIEAANRQRKTGAPSPAVAK
ncbi:MAG: hypothetical protein IJ601_04235 [Acidaminococcaceae bacterium]|nr:hypothetical protein [Acidaminococcaceae bacterium]